MNMTTTKVALRIGQKFCLGFTILRLWRQLLPTIAITYICFLFVLSQAAPETRCTFLRFLDSDHTCTPPHEISHISDCSFRPAAVYTVIDRFVLAHLLGWLVKAFLLPERTLLWSASLGFEILEWILSGWIPTFQECWWDSLVLDVLLCNFIGIEMGLWLCRWVGRKVELPNVWHCLSLCPTMSEKVHLRPHALLPKAAIVVLLLLTDLNAFLLKKALLVQSSSPLNIYRLVGITLLAASSVRIFAKEDNQEDRIGITFLYLTTLLCEVTTTISLSVNKF